MRDGGGDLIHPLSRSIERRPERLRFRMKRNVPASKCVRWRYPSGRMSTPDRSSGLRSLRGWGARDLGDRSIRSICLHGADEYESAFREVGPAPLIPFESRNQIESDVPSRQEQVDEGLGAALLGLARDRAHEITHEIEAEPEYGDRPQLFEEHPEDAEDEPGPGETSLHCLKPPRWVFVDLECLHDPSVY